MTWRAAIFRRRCQTLVLSTVQRSALPSLEVLDKTWSGDVFGLHEAVLNKATTRRSPAEIPVWGIKGIRGVKRGGAFYYTHSSHRSTLFRNTLRLAYHGNFGITMSSSNSYRHQYSLNHLLLAFHSLSTTLDHLKTDLRTFPKNDLRTREVQILASRGLRHEPNRTFSKPYAD